MVNKKFIKIFFLVSLFFGFLAEFNFSFFTFAQAAEPGTVRMGWYLESGKKFNVKWPTHLRWGVLPEIPGQAPRGVFRIWTSMPKKYQIHSVVVTPANKFKITYPSPTFPGQLAPEYAPMLFEMTSLSKVSIFTISIKDERTGGLRRVFMRFEMDETPANIKRFTPTPIQPPRASFKAGVQGSYVTYSETLPQKTLTQIGVTVKVGANYVLRPKAWDVDGGAFFTALPVSATVNIASMSAARFYGAHVKFTYSFPWTLGPGRLSLGLGWYFWGMLVPSASYGISSAYGPELFLSYKSVQPGSRSWGLYLKAAPIVRQSLTYDSRELAVGGFFQLTDPDASRHFYLTVDASDLQLPAPDSSSIASSSNSLSLGIMMDL